MYGGHKFMAAFLPFWNCLPQISEQAGVCFYIPTINSHELFVVGQPVEMDVLNIKLSDDITTSHSLFLFWADALLHARHKIQSVYLNSFNLIMHEY